MSLRDDEPTTKDTDSVMGDNIQDGNCQCDKNNKPAPKFTSGREAEQHESIEFENALQNMVSLALALVIWV